ncbi:hypothetical protein PRIPAC_97316 [Pristionchus pacificus]|uniref:Uncharacterized protein n=1 Tax=Pristionchus pacificus TaxID=54126 RepID=A0A2A6CV00_PRIPA|nr:hypothetical protein PRIPAC_97316 [Pristionchus pacificus]|eukprot:PDM81948.1 hypothetical protein PRIPAC_34102 [Pristionchus pacificus]
MPILRSGRDTTASDSARNTELELERMFSTVLDKLERTFLAATLPLVKNCLAEVIQVFEGIRVHYDFRTLFLTDREKIEQIKDQLNLMMAHLDILSVLIARTANRAESRETFI